MRAMNPSKPWMIGGDFNIVLHSSKRKGGARPKLHAMEDFADAILDCNLTDVGFEGSDFTWTNFKMLQQLDRNFYSLAWKELFTNTRVQHISRTCFNHHGKLISLSSPNMRKPSSFRFLNMWVQHHKFLEDDRENLVLPYLDNWHVREYESRFDLDPRSTYLVELKKANAFLYQALSMEKAF
ncbi:UNVERIFIED_CONTAM: hypothetical protein Sradi_3187900 [Sesamum radiatum]|uniref:Uncharacterized protein n=1 Tax=Sesamum radiatum TaxID=300843 RepID=A0AAW2RFN3_SESRA